MSLTPTEFARFEEKTRPAGDCIVWVGKTDKDGYGYMTLRRKGRRVHRIAYFHKFGPIPTGCVVHHTCRVRNCVNPDHLRLATSRDNSLRESNSVASLNARKVHCAKGHPFDRKYGGQRYCSICEAAKSKRLRDKWKAVPDTLIGC